MTRAPPLAALVALLLLAVHRCDGAIHPYRAARFTPTDGAHVLRAGREGLYASVGSDHRRHDVKGDFALSDGGRGHEKAYVRFEDVEFRRSRSHASRFTGADSEGKDTGAVHAVLFELKDHFRIGWTDPRAGTRHLCCDSPDLVADTGCVMNDVLIAPPDDGREPEPGWPWVRRVEFVGDHAVRSMSAEQVTVTRDGMYYLWFVTCDASLGESLTVTGRTTWRNPHGYLPGMMRHTRPFFGTLALAYGGLVFWWTAKVAKVHVKRPDVLTQLHHCVTAVVAASFTEAFLWYADYEYFNAVGVRPVALTLLAVFFSAARESASRTLVLVVSTGYGVVRPTLGGLSTKVVGLGTAYFVAAVALDAATHVGNVDDLTQTTRVLLVVPVALMDATYILWIFSSLSRTLTQLRARRQLAKLALYARFTNVLAVSVVGSVMWILYETWFRATDALNQKWQVDWVVGAFWHVLSFLLLGAICVLWAPSDDAATQFAYGEVSGKDDATGAMFDGFEGWDFGDGDVGAGGYSDEEDGRVEREMRKVPAGHMGGGKGMGVGQTPLKGGDVFLMDSDDEREARLARDKMR